MREMMIVNHLMRMAHYAGVVNETDLRVFLTLAETENSRDAAALLQVNQSNVSRALARLESELEAELFTRHGRRLSLNRVGQAFRADALGIVGGCEAGRQRVLRLAGPQAPIRLGFLQSMARWVVPRLVSSFREVAPGALFELRQGFARDLHEAVSRDDLDVTYATPPRPDSGLAWQLIEEQQLCVALSRSHRLAGRASLSCADLDGEDFIAFARPTELRQLIDPLLVASGARVRVAFESREIDTIAGLVGAGLGVSILPVSAGRSGPEVTVVPLQPSTTRCLGLAWSTERVQPVSVQRFIAHCSALDVSVAGAED